jgi:hypothetical protein
MIYKKEKMKAAIDKMFSSEKVEWTGDPKLDLKILESLFVEVQFVNEENSKEEQ